MIVGSSEAECFDGAYRACVLRQIMSNTTFILGKNGAALPSYHGTLVVQPGDDVVLYRRTTFEQYYRGTAVTTDPQSGAVTVSPPVPLSRVQRYDLMQSLTRMPSSIYIFNNTFEYVRGGMGSI